MAFTKSEVAPLVGNAGPSPLASTLKRRTAPQVSSVPFYLWAEAASCQPTSPLITFSLSSSTLFPLQHENLGIGTYVTSNEDFSKKEDKRSCCGQCCYRVNRFVCAKPAMDSSNIYYEDSYNDDPWECTFGTNQQDGIWMNNSDQVGTIMSSMVWVLMIYSVITISLLAQHKNLANHIAMIYGTICALALASHAKTQFTDPGSIPQEAVPLASLFKQGITTHAMCSHCQTYKPPDSHHCRICNRCISRMDRKWNVTCADSSQVPCFGRFVVLKKVCSSANFFLALLPRPLPMDE